MIRDRLRVFPVVALLGPRQCGKTTLARSYFNELNGGRLNYFDLEDPQDLARLDQPQIALSELRGLVVIDEIQRKPDLFPLLRVLVDRANVDCRFLILGSASPELIHQGSESLAGRIGFIELTPFTLFETGMDPLFTLWSRGGFPRSFLAEDDASSLLWRKNFIQTFLERDIPALGISLPAEQMRRFWIMLAHYHGQILNTSELARSMGLSDSTIRRYVDLLCGTYMVRRLTPYHANISKRQVKSPKIIIRDSGLLHCLLNIPDLEQLKLHPKLGASWEGFATETVIASLGADSSEVNFWGVHQQGELDLLVLQNGKRLGFEIKFADAPTRTQSMELAMESLSLDELTVIYPGDMDYPLGDRIRVKGITHLSRMA
jgi:uncharacterized protein